MQKITQRSLAFALGASVAAGAFFVSATFVAAITGTFMSNTTVANLPAIDDQTAVSTTTIANVTAGADNFQALTLATTTPNNPGSPAVAQVTEFVPANVEVGDEFIITIIANSYGATSTTGTVQEIVELLQPQVHSDPDVNCTEDDTKVECTAAVAGVAFTFSTNTIDGGGTNNQTLDATTTTPNAPAVGADAQVNTVTPANVEIGDVFTVTINGTPIAFTATDASVVNVTAGLTSAINGSSEGANVFAADTSPTVTITAIATGTPFTISSNATNRAAVTQVNTITIGGTVEAGDTFTANVPVDGAVNYVATSTDTTNDNIATGLNAAIQAAPNYATAGYTSTVAGNVITLTASTPGTPFTVTSGTTNRTAIAQITEFTPALPTIGETYRATINGINYDFTVVSTSSVQEIVEALEPIMEGNADTTCTEDDTKITCTANVAGTAFTHAATVVDITAPVVLSVDTSHADGSYPAGTVIPFTITFSEPVTVVGTPLLGLNAGGTASSSYASGSGTATLTFNYTVTAGQNSSDLGYSATNSLTLNGGTIKDAATNDATLTLPAEATFTGAHAIVVDTTPPTVTITVVDTGIAIGETSLVTFAFSEPVTGFTNDDIVLTNANGTLDVASSTGATTYAAVFTPNAVEDATNVISVNMAGVQDAATNPGVGTTNSNNYAIDTLAPVIGSVSFHVTTGTLAIGDILIVTIDADQTGYTLGGATTVNDEGVTNFDDNADTTYEVWYTVSQGDTDIGQNEQIPVNIVLIDGFNNETTFTTSPPFGLSPAIDANPPAVPSQPDMCDCDDSGFSDTDNLTNIEDPFFEGTADIGSTVSLFVDGVLVGQELVNTVDGWLIQVGPLADGTYTIEATATDAAGNTSATSTATLIEIDTTAPATPLAPDLQAGSDTGDSSTDDLTNNTNPTFEVNAEAGSIITLYVDGNPENTAVSTGATTTITLTLPLSEGVYAITIDATDAAGNESAESPALMIEVDTTEPMLDEEVPVAEYTNDTTPDYTFSSDDNGTISYGGSCLSAQTLAAAGNNLITLTNTSSDPFADGEYNDCTVIVTDSAGNDSDPLAISTFTIDTDAPDASAVAFVDTYININGATTTVITFTITDINNVMVVFPTLTDASSTVITPFAIATTSGTNPFTFSATFDASSLVDGTVTADATANDYAGNVGVSGGTAVATKDTVRPTVTAVDSDGDLYSSLTASPVTIMVTFSEAMDSAPSIEVEGDAQTVSECGLMNDTQFCFDYAVPANTDLTTMTIDIWGADDYAGNVMLDDSSHTFQVDTKGPVAANVVADDPVNAGNVSSVSATFDITDNATLFDIDATITDGFTTVAAYSIGSLGGNTYQALFDASTLVDGEGALVVSVFAEDVNGNVGGTATHSMIDKDTVLPTLTFSPNGGDVTRNSNLTVEVVFSEPVQNGTPMFAISGLNNVPAAVMTMVSSTTYQGVVSVPDANGSITVTITNGTDLFGNEMLATSTTYNSVGGGSGGGGGGGGGGGPIGLIGPGAITGGTPPSQPTGQVLGATTFNFSFNFGIGSSGAHVTELQKILIAGGFLDIPEPTGYFGALTQAAVRAYQQSKGITPVTGYVGPLTRAALNEGEPGDNAQILGNLLAQLALLQAQLNQLLGGNQ